MALRQSDIDCTVDVCLTFTPVEEGDEAGLTAFISRDGHLRFAITRDEAGPCAIIARSDAQQPIVRQPIAGNEFSLRLVADRERYTFCIASAGGLYRCIGSVPVLTRAHAGKCFTGTLLGVYAQCTGPTSARAVLHSFRISPGVP